MQGRKYKVPYALSGWEGRDLYTLSNNKVFFIDKILAIPLAVYFWWYGCRKKLGAHRKKISVGAAKGNK